MNNNTIIRIIILILLCFITGCGMIDFRQKSIATESKVIGLDLSVPEIVSAGTSIASIKMGYITTKYISAPVGGKASINDQLDNVSIWSLSGGGKSSMSVENDTGYCCVR